MEDPRKEPNPGTEETPTGEQKKKNKNPALMVRNVMLGMFLLVMAFSAYKLGSIMVNWSKSNKAYKGLASEVVTAVPPAKENGDKENAEASEEAPGAENAPEKERAPIAVDMDALLQRNPDTVAWLYCEDSPIDFAVVQTTDNYTYLGRDFDGQPSVFGWTFMDYRCSGDFSSPVSTVYGHNMQNGSVFAVLEKYQSQQFYEEHPVMWLLTPDGDYKVELMAGIFQLGIEPVYAGYDGDEEGFRSFLETAVRDSSFDSGIEADTVEHAVMLSTCSNTRPDYRFAVIGALRPLEN